MHMIGGKLTHSNDAYSLVIKHGVLENGPLK